MISNRSNLIHENGHFQKNKNTNSNMLSLLGERQMNQDYIIEKTLGFDQIEAKYGVSRRRARRMMNDE